MRNGYALPPHEGLTEIADRLRGASEAELDDLRQQLRIGIQWNTQVTLGGGEHTVSQAYCSALPVAYCRHPAQLWEPFARLVLEAAYEATLCAAMLVGGRKTVFLTLLGGGAFGNPTPWIFDAIERAFHLRREAGLDIAVVSYRASDEGVRKLMDRVRD